MSKRNKTPHLLEYNALKGSSSIILYDFPNYSLRISAKNILRKRIIGQLSVYRTLIISNFIQENLIS